jgi:hypothetical protein
MNDWFLSLLAQRWGRELPGKTVFSCRYFDPLVTIDVGERAARRADSRLVVILAFEGPFVFGTSRDPLEGFPTRRIFEETTARVIRRISHEEGKCTLGIEVGDEEDDFELRIHLFGNRGAMALKSMDIVMRSLGESAQSTAPARGEVAVAPAFCSVTADELGRILESEGPIRGLDKSLATFFRDASAADAARALVEFRDEVSRGGRFFSLMGTADPRSTVPFPCEGVGGDDAALGRFEDPLQAAEKLGLIAASRALKAAARKKARPLATRLKARKKLLARLALELEEAAKHETLRKEAETLAAYQSLIKPGSSEVELPDPYRDGATIRIGIDPSLGVQEQIQRRFKRASKLERSIEPLKKRMALLERETVEIEDFLERLETEEAIPDTFDEIDVLVEKHGLRRHRRPEPGKESRRSFRRFELDDDWFVIVGRNNRENDAITFHEAAPNDLWFHAQNVPGSHVVLKSRRPPGNPPRGIIEAAAAVAAYFSKAKHSSLVPVIYTMRKYVRKPRKAGPGLVTCTREKTILVEPALPSPRA